MMHRISFSVVVALLSFFLVAAAGEDLPDLDKIAERHRAILDSIRSGGITYIEEQTPGTTDLEEFTNYYRQDLEETLRKCKAAGADASSITIWEGQLADFKERARSRIISDIKEHRVELVFDKQQSAAKSTVTDLRDVESLMARWNVPGEAETRRSDYVNWTSRELYKHLRPAKGISAPSLNIGAYDAPAEELPVRPLWSAGYSKELAESAAESTNEDVVRIEWRRDDANPDLWIQEIVLKPEAEEYYRVIKDGAGTDVMIPLDEPRTARYVTVFDESNDFRRAWRKVYYNDVLRYEYTYEYADDPSVLLPTVTQTIVYRPDGSVERTNTNRLVSAELNVAIDPSELELVVPSDAVIYDSTSGKTVIITPDAKEDIADALGEAPFDEELPLPDLEEIAEEAPEEVPAAQSEPPAIEEEPAPQDDGGAHMIMVGIALIVIAAIIAVTLWARRGKTRGGAHSPHS